MANDLSPSLDKLATRIRTEHAAVAAAFERGAMHARNAGELLRDAKRQIKHGEWMTWLTIHCEMSDRTATNYMRIAKRWPEIEANRESLADLSQSKALEVISRPPAKIVQLVPPSEAEAREQFAAVEARGAGLAAVGLEDAFTLEALPAGYQDNIARGDAELQAAKPGGVKALLGMAKDYVAGFAPAPPLPRADAEGKALEAFTKALIEAHEDAGESPEDIRDSLFEIAELLLCCDHPVRWGGYLRTRGKEIAAEAEAAARRSGTGQ